MGRTHDGEVTQFSGLDNLNYEFRWNPILEAYVYPPRSQAEVDNLLGLAKFKEFPYLFSVIYFDATVGSGTTSQDKSSSAVFMAPTIRPYIKPDNYAEFPAVDLLGLARDLGFEPQGDQANCDNLKRQIHANCIGRAWAIEELRQLREQVKAMEAKVRETEVKLAVFSVPTAVTEPAAPATSVSVRRKPGPKPGSKRRSYAHLRDLQPA